MTGHVAADLHPYPHVLTPACELSHCSQRAERCYCTFLLLMLRLPQRNRCALSAAGVACGSPCCTLQHGGLGQASLPGAACTGRLPLKPLCSAASLPPPLSSINLVPVQRAQRREVDY